MLRLWKNGGIISGLLTGRNTFDLRDGVGEYVIRLHAFHRVNGFLKHVLYRRPKSTRDQT
jgi:hypothetical protein